MKASAVTLAWAASVRAAAPSTWGTEWTKTLFLDDFTGGSGAAPDASQWIVQTGTQYPGGAAQWGTGELQSYTASGNNVRQAGNGELWIIPQKASNGAWTSGRIETRSDNFQAPAGGKVRVEARIKLPDVSDADGIGYWPAFWALGCAFRANYTDWPFAGELDIMEHIGGRDTVTAGMHCDVNPGGACNEPGGIGTQTRCTGSRCPGRYHIYEMIVDRTSQPEQVKFWLDRSLQLTISSAQFAPPVWHQSVNQGFYLVLNLAMGGAYPDAVHGTTTPIASTVGGKPMAVDYVAVWSTS